LPGNATLIGDNQRIRSVQKIDRFVASGRAIQKLFRLAQGVMDAAHWPSFFFIT
jgi:hypothetical protein